MADELERSRLDVVLAPSEVDPRGKVRVVQEENPEWYKRFCAKYASARVDARKWRKHKTAVKRLTTLRALRRIAEGCTELHHNGKPSYIPMILPIIEEELRKRRAEDAQVQRDHDRDQANVPF